MPRADAQRNVDALLSAAKDEFTAHGVDVPVRAIAARAGVGTATLYRHFPLRSDLIAAVFRREIDDVTALAARLAAMHPPVEALELWAQRYTEFVATKHGLGAALHSGDPAYSGLREYFEGNAGPALQRLLDHLHFLLPICLIGWELSLGIGGMGATVGICRSGIGSIFRHVGVADSA